MQLDVLVVVIHAMSVLRIIYSLIKMLCCYAIQVERACSLIEEGQVGELYCARANYWESLGR